MSDAVDISVDSDLRMVMRKMLKRDNVTRLKVRKYIYTFFTAIFTFALFNIIDVFVIKYKCNYRSHYLDTWPKTAYIIGILLHMRFEV